MTAEHVALVQQTLLSLTPDEREEAVKWLRVHVTTNSPDVQRILIETWLSIYNRPLWARVFEVRSK